MNDPKLKLAVAERLPDQIIIHPMNDTTTRYIWKHNLATVLETEWLYIVHLAEQKLSDTQGAIQLGKETEMKSEAESRKEFEEWITQNIPPHRRKVTLTHYPDGVGMAGEYASDLAAIAWEAWQEARKDK
jgi:hypothetical protein